MGRFRKVDPRIWNDTKFRALDDSGKLVFLFVLTHPYLTSLGAMRATIPGLAAELGWELKAFAEAFQKGSLKGLVEVDEEAGFVSLPNFLRYNPPENPNVVKSWSNQADLLPECKLKDLLLQRVEAFTEAKGEAFAKAFMEAFGKPFRTPLPNPKPKPEPKPEPKKERVSADADVPSQELLQQEQELITQWNTLSGITANRGNALTDKRRTMFRARLKSPKWFEEAFEAMERFPLQCQLDERHEVKADAWKPSLDWFLKPDSVTQVLEGKYDFSKANGNGKPVRRDSPARIRQRG